MAYPVSSDFIQALKNPRREIDIETRIKGWAGDTRFGPDGINIIDGDVTVDWDNYKQGPVWTVDMTLADPDRELDIDLDDGDSRPLWLSCKLDIRYGLRLADGSWEYCPIFRGWIEDVERYGSTLQLLGGGKEVRHQPPYVLPHSYMVEAGTKYSRALKDFIDHRGLDDDLFDIPVLDDDPEFRRNYFYGLGMNPWLMMQNWADQLDRQFMFTPDGHALTRDWLEREDWVWEFSKTNKPIILEYPHQRLSMNDFFNTVFVITDKMVQDGPQAGTRPEPVIGYAELPAFHSLSDNTLTGGKKPAIRIAERLGLSTFTGANLRADKILSGGASGLDAEMSTANMVLPHLWPMDPIKLGFGSEGIDIHIFRARRFNVPLVPEAEQQINWHGTRKPMMKRKNHFTHVHGRRRRSRGPYRARRSGR